MTGRPRACRTEARWLALACSLLWVAPALRAARDLAGLGAVNGNSSDDTVGASALDGPAQQGNIPKGRSLRFSQVEHYGWGVRLLFVAQCQVIAGTCWDRNNIAKLAAET